MKSFAFVLGLAIAGPGCAIAIEDPPPAPVVAEPQRDPPQKTFYGELNDPFADLVAPIDEYRSDFDVPPKQVPDISPYFP